VKVAPSVAIDYTSKPGDVVEFDGEVGLCFTYNMELKVIWCEKTSLNTTSTMGMMWLDVNCRLRVNFIGHIDQPITSWTEASDALKAYFSRPQFKVGDRVRIARNPEEGESVHGGWNTNMAKYVGGCYHINRVSDNRVRFTEISYAWDLKLLEPA